MKFLSQIVCVVLLAACCSAQKNNAVNTSKNKLTVQKNNATKPQVAYVVASRGYFESLSINGSALVYSTDNTLKKVQHFNITEAEQKTLNQLIKTIDVNALKTLKAPTNKRLYDGAKHAVVSIIKNEKVYQSASFDEGFPPKDIEALINHLLTIKKRVLKP